VSRGDRLCLSAGAVRLTAFGPLCAGQEEIGGASDLQEEVSMVFAMAALIGLLPAAIASQKGRSFLGWWCYGALLFIVALPHSLLIRKVVYG